MDIVNIPDDLLDIERAILFLRIADELDIGTHRCCDYSIQGRRIPMSNSVFWHQNQLTECNISKINDITLTVKLSKKDYDNHKGCFKIYLEKFKQKNETIVAKLRKLGIIISISEVSSNVLCDEFQTDIDGEIIDDLYIEITGIRKVDLNYSVNFKRVQNRINCYICYSIDGIKRKLIEEFTNYLSVISNKLFIYTDSYNHTNNDIDNAEVIIIVIDETILTKKQIVEINLVNQKYAMTKKGCAYYILNFSDTVNKSQIHSVFNLYSAGYFEGFDDFKLRKVTKGKKAEYHVSDEIKKGHREVLEKIVSDGTAVVQLNSDKFKKIVDFNLRNFFLDRRSDNMNLPLKCFVKTKVYNKVKNGGIHIVKGRKGSGKSLLIKTVTDTDEGFYKGAINIITHKIDLSQLFNDLLSLNEDFINNAKSMSCEISNDNKKIRRIKDGIASDIVDIFNIEKTLTIIWEVYIYLYSALLVNKEYIYNNLLSAQKDYFDIFLTEFRKSFAHYNNIDIKDCTHIIYPYAKEIVFEYIQNTIDKQLENNKNYADVIGNVLSLFNTYNILTDKWGEEAIQAYGELLKLCKKRIIVTFDCWDVSIDKIRQDIPHTAKYNCEIISNFEIDWLNSFYELIYSLLRTPQKQEQLYLGNLLDCLICIPHDRYLESMKFNRDSHKYEDLTSDLCWSGVELAIMLRKRIVHIYGELENIQRGNDTAPAEKKLELILSSQFPTLPQTVNIIINDKVHSIGLFQYVLRMSFWRPRDILNHFNEILSLVILNEKENIDPERMKEMVKRAVKDATIKIIDEEFIKEYTAIMPNIGKIINEFKNSNVILKWAEIKAILDGTDFASVKPMQSFEDKFSFLYYIGFIGIRPTPKIKDDFSLLHDDVFIFNEKDSVLRSIDGPEFSKCEFIIHPAFTNKLSLNFNTDDVLCNFSWEYLHQNEPLQ